MSYEKTELTPVMENEVAVILDTGDIVAVSVSRSVSGSRMVFSGMARYVKSDGRPKLDRYGQPIKSELKHSDPRVPLADLILKDCFLALLGEPVETVEWSNQWLIDVNIRQAIAMSKIGNFDPSNLI